MPNLRHEWYTKSPVTRGIGPKMEADGTQYPRTYCQNLISTNFIATAADNRAHPASAKPSNPSASATLVRRPYPPFLREAFTAYKQLEDDFFRTLPKSVRATLGHGDIKRYDPNYLRFYGEVAFTLAGVKPCTMFMHGLSDEFVVGIVEKCVKPMMKRFSLESKGFELFRVEKELYPCYRNFAYPPWPEGVLGVRQHAALYVPCGARLLQVPHDRSPRGQRHDGDRFRVPDPRGTVRH